MFLIAIAVIFSAPIVAVLIHILGNRFGILSKSKPQRGAILSVLMTVGVLSLGILVQYPEWRHSLSSVLFLAVLLFLAAHLYFQIFNLSETARRIRILVEIKMKIVPQIDTVLSVENKIEKRIQRLVELGQIQKTEERFIVVKSWLLLIALMFRKFERSLYPERF